MLIFKVLECWFHLGFTLKIIVTLKTITLQSAFWHINDGNRSRGWMRVVFERNVMFLILFRSIPTKLQLRERLKQMYYQRNQFSVLMCTLTLEIWNVPSKRPRMQITNLVKCLLLICAKICFSNFINFLPLLHSFTSLTESYKFNTNRYTRDYVPVKVHKNFKNLKLKNKNRFKKSVLIYFVLICKNLNTTPSSAEVFA